MFDSAIIEVAIGLIFIYALLSLLCSALSEIFSQIFKMRSETLAKGIKRLITDDNALKDFNDHPLISSLRKKDKGSPPSYIPSRMFALALLDSISTTRYTGVCGAGETGIQTCKP